jgi:hypothetical protein
MSGCDGRLSLALSQHLHFHSVPWLRSRAIIKLMTCTLLLGDNIYSLGYPFIYRLGRIVWMRQIFDHFHWTFPISSCGTTLFSSSVWHPHSSIH